MFSACTCTCMYAVNSVCAVPLHTHDTPHAICLVGAVVLISYLVQGSVHTIKID